MLLLGTAGHIDHGKTALIRALTGVDTDRLPEEKARGITIELGFAPLTLPSGQRLGVVDAPGHEKLVRTMVAGAGGLDLLLLAVAADEGVMPQTREHLEICRLLGLREGVVALTRSDLADPEISELAQRETRELLAGSPFAAAPIVPVSAQTGDGLPALVSALDLAAARARTQRSHAGPPRLFVDRCFERRGFGPVVTGTLLGAPLETGAVVTLHPGGSRAQVRGIQCFGATAERLSPGTRCALNLRGVALSELERGMLLSIPDALHETTRFDARVEWLPGAKPHADAPQAVELLVGSAHFRARVAAIGDSGAPSRLGALARPATPVDRAKPLTGALPRPAPSFDRAKPLSEELPHLTTPVDRAEPLTGALARPVSFFDRAEPLTESHGHHGHGFARLHLDSGAAALLPGDNFILRGFARLASGGATVGGGTVLDVRPPARRRSDPALLRELETLCAATPATALHLRIERAGFSGTTRAALRRETGLELRALDDALAALEAAGEINSSRDQVIAASALAELEARLLRALSEHHDQQPLQPGMARAALLGALPANVARETGALALARLEARGALQSEGEVLRASDHIPLLSQRDEYLAASIRADAMIAGLEPPTLAELRAALGIEEQPLRDLLAHLERDGSLLRAPGDLWFDRGAVDELRARVVAHLEAQGAVQTSDYKKLIGVTRKFAVPLMELFDNEHLTIRQGDARVLRRRGLSSAPSR